VISIYLDDVAPGLARPQIVAGQAERLLEFFGDKTLDQMTGALCRAYVEHRDGQGRSNKGTGGGARRDLQTLAAAINHHHAEGMHRESVRVVLPARGQARQRWLTRDEVRRLWRVCMTTRELQGGKETGRRPLAHLGRFILFGAFTGSRPGALLGANWDRAIGRGWIDLGKGLFYRHADGARATAKRQPPVPLAPALWRLMRLWARQDDQRGPVVRFGGQPVLSVKTALGRAVRLAGLDGGVTAYTLRHTTASWLLQSGVSTAKAAAILGTSEAMVEKHYGHLAPDHLRAEVAMLAGGQSGGKRRRAV
jgi:integrase